MAYFKVEPIRDASVRDLQTTTCPGPFVVEAKKPEDALELLALNFGTMISRPHGEEIPFAIWSDGGAHQVSEIAKVDAGTLRQTRIAHGMNIAPFFLQYGGELRGRGGELRATMIWWPCSPNDRCPV